jgi:hypothetical protein
MTARNPFEYVGANDLPSDTIADYYIEDFNYSRFIQSPRNILLVGERGCGKSMTLLYNSFPVQQLLAARKSSPLTLETIGVYVPCNTPLTHKREFQLLDEFRAAVASEHQLVLTIAYSISETLSRIPMLLDSSERDLVRKQLEYIFGSEMPENDNVFFSIMAFVDRENIRTQRVANSRTTTDVFYEDTFSFSSLIVPFVRMLRSVIKLTNAHFAFLIDDAHDLNEHQRRALFSWIAYRDHSLFSFKVAVANVTQTPLVTASGGSILEGHDYTRIDMTAPFHNEETDFGMLSRKLISKRLATSGIQIEPKDFFPISKEMASQLDVAKAAIRQEAELKYGDDKKKVADHIYKYARAHFFRSRSSKANRPEYSGFDTLVFLSTGVIRNLLIPCYWMWDKVVSLASDNVGPDHCTDLPKMIPPSVQSEIILWRSSKLWEWMRNELDMSIEGCSRETATRAYQLLDNLAVLFRERLLKHKSEPRANSFTISGRDEAVTAKLEPVLRILIAAQLLYVRSGSAKEKGKRESYYVPNRMLWPDRGLDPHGQHARVSIPVADLWQAAENNRPFPFDDEDENGAKQPRLFDVD